MSAKVSIGDFSRASHLSVKTLRHYHQVGLLEPSEVDPDSGYRYYSEDQLPLAQVIRRLRGLQMPVPDVKAVVVAPDAETRNGLIVEHLDRLEQELARTRGAVGELRDLLGRPETSRPVELRSVPATPAAGIGAVIEREDVLDWWQGALGELAATVRAQGLKPEGPSGGVYDSEIFQHGRGRATVFVPVQVAVRPVGRVMELVVPPAELAVIRHRGSLEGIDLTYAELGAYVMRHEIGIDGPLRENYPRGFLDDEDPNTWETEIGWPVFRSDPGD